MHTATFCLFLEDWIHEAQVARTELMQKIHQVKIHWKFTKVNKNEKNIQWFKWCRIQIKSQFWLTILIQYSEPSCGCTRPLTWGESHPSPGTRSQTDQGGPCSLCTLHWAPPQLGTALTILMVEIALIKVNLFLKRLHC